MNKFMRTSIKLISIFAFLLVAACHSGESERQSSTLKNPVSEQDGDVVFGAETAPFTIFMYASYNCTYCRYFFSKTLPELKSNFLDDGKVKLVVKWVDFQDNPQVLKALQAASCISRYGEYEKYHELLLVNPDVVFTEDFDLLLDDIMQNNEHIAECILNDPEYSYLRSNVKEFRENNLNGTPTFILNKQVYNGFISYENFVKLLNKEFKVLPTHNYL